MSYILCRCGSYPRIRRAIHRAAAWSAAEPMQRTDALGALPAGDARGGTMLSPWLRVNRDRSITLLVDRSEMGQGTLTGLAMLAAEELEIEPERLHVEFAPAAREYANPLIGEQLTGGSTSIRAAWDELRRSSAEVRERLIAAAAERWKVRRSECRAEAGEVLHDRSGRRAAYAALAAAAAAKRAPRNIRLKRPQEFRVIGRSVPRLELPDLALGRAAFALDLTPPNAVDAVLARCPSFGGRPASFDAASARRVPGVIDVIEVGSAIAVVAENTAAALAGRAQLGITWNLADAFRLDSDAIRERLVAALGKRGARARERGNVDRALSRAKQVLDATYETPYLAHATMEPMSCIAALGKGGCDVWVGTQAQTRAQEVAMAITGLPRKQVRVHTTYLGGGFGRRLETDYVAEAVRLAKILRRPVRVLWTRADDMQHDFYRPASITTMRAGLDASGALTAWLQRIAGPDAALGEVDIPYAVPNLREVHVEEDPGVPTGYWRSVGASQNAFAVECFVDELARAADKDPLAYRLELLERRPRYRRVLELAARRVGWDRPLAEGKGRGIAVYHSYGSWVAQVADVSVTPDALRVDRIVCAIDCGSVVNPNAVAAQMEGAVVFGLSAALYGEITLRNGAVQQSGFENYPILRMPDTPTIEVHIVPSPAPPGGVGEPGLPPVAPAVANAVFAATGTRIRRLPLARR
jgi:isoquinoline 1-oxidoreductase beta subunit